MGISDAALLPITQTVMTLATIPVSYNQSAQAIGSVIGPMLAAGVAGVLDYRYVFLMTTGLVLINLGIVMWAYKADYKTVKETR